MKKIVLSIIVLISLLSLGYTQGINFQKLTYEEAMDIARKERKNIFVDIYTTWCGPCKQMAAQVFSDKEVGDFMNNRFVSMKLDAENEASHGLFKKYKAQGYPTFFWLTADGELMDVQVGFKPKLEFIQLSEKAIASNLGVKRAALEKRWNAGERSYQLVTEYVYGILGKVDGDKVKPAIESYLASLSKEEISKPENSKIIAGFMSREWHGDMFKYIVGNIQSIESAIGYLDTKIMLYRMYIRSSNAALASGDKTAAMAHRKFLESQTFPDKEMYMDILDAETELHQENYSKGVKGFDSILKRYGKEHPYLYREFSYSLVSSGSLMAKQWNTQENKTLQEIGSMAFELNPSQETLIYLAAVYAAGGDYKKAYENAAAMQFYKKPALPGILFAKDLGVSTTVKTPYSEQSGLADMRAKLEAKK